MDNISNEVIINLKNKYSTPESRVGLRLNEDLITQILDIIKYLGYDISPNKSFPTENISATAISFFETTLKNWLSSSNQEMDMYNIYIPTEQILRDLISEGWIINPPQ